MSNTTTPSTTATPADDRELVLERIIDVPAAKLYRGWTEPALVTQWFAPAPWSTPRAELDVRAGGTSFVVMADPEGNEYPNAGVYLEVIPGKKIVFTDAFTAAWTPSKKPFFVGTITFEDLGNGKTRYTARAQHWSVEDAKAHVEMGFHTGWGICADQLAAVAAKL